jgi:hypothetical protein
MVAGKKTKSAKAKTAAKTKRKTKTKSSAGRVARTKSPSPKVRSKPATKSKSKASTLPKPKVSPTTTPDPSGSVNRATTAATVNSQASAPSGFQVEGTNGKAPFTLKLHRGEGMTLVAMNWKNGQPPQNFVGFAIEYQEPGGSQYYALNNRLGFLDASGNVDASAL